MKFLHSNTILIYLLSFSSLFAQDTIRFSHSFPIKGDFIELDNIGNIYLVKGQKLLSLNIDGKVTYENSNLALGEITSLDASNALKMPVFFRDLSQVVYVDNKIGQIGERVQLDVAGFPLTYLVCTSSNNGLWMYDPFAFELIRLSEQFQIASRTGNLNQILGVPIEPEYMREYNNFLVLALPEEGILIFDRFGTYIKTVPVKGVKRFQIRSDRIYYLEDDGLGYYDLKFSTLGYLNWEVGPHKSFAVWNDVLAVLRENRIDVYHIIER
jgi:hypothetical protein